MPAFPAPERRAARMRHGAPALRAALAGAAATVLLAGCAIAESDTDRLGRKAAADAVDPVDTAASPPSTAPGPAPDPTRSPAPEARLLRNPPRQVRPAIAPAHGTTVGIGQPVSLAFKGQKVDPALRAGIEGRMEIKTSTGVVGAWHWAEAKGDTHLHFRPREYWPAGTEVTLDARLAGVKLDDRTAAGNRRLTFRVGPAMVSKVDLAAHTLTVVKDGTPLRTIPVSGGDVIEVTGTTGKPMDHFGNGYGDWNLSWDEWLRGSTLGASKS
ncbi:Ig-like domain-containing protein [Streptomyces sp. NBC_00335]|uniref:Ig-like domain-containing protein n=1 Tax=unclassified Streptomyces TaxID=2593676 RepID=UPI002256EED7|nr:MULTISPECIES: Ig-like domain-containing protein [unclassified Streptomyces]MCX5403254.1 Ig-like domain-containing protein [Streptomyces sp. NBC_00086]